MTTFVTSLTGSVLRIALLYFLIPQSGMTGCFISLMLSQLVLCALELILVHYHTDFKLSVYRIIILPAVAAATLGFLCHRAYLLFTNNNGNADSLLPLLAACSVFSLAYLLLPVRFLFMQKQ